MKFAFLIQRPGLGGLASMHDRLAEALEEKGHQVDKLVVQDEHVIKNVKNSDYDVVHLYFTPFLNLKFFLRLLGFNLLTDKKVFVNYYNIKPENLFRRSIKRVFLPLLCDKVILPSENMEQFYRDEIGINNTATLRPIVEDKFYDINSNGNNIIYFGHSRPDKGIDRLIEIASEDDPIHCYFIQNREHVFEQHPELEEKIQKGPIIWHDELPEEALSNARVALFPFHHLESTVDLPLALVESLAAEVPVLASKISPLSQHLPEEFLVEDWNRENVMERIKQLSNEEHRDIARGIAEDMDLDKESVFNQYLGIIHGQDPR